MVFTCRVQDADVRFTNDVEQEANSHFQKLYLNERPITETVEMLQVSEEARSNIDRFLSNITGEFCAVRQAPSIMIWEWAVQPGWSCYVSSTCNCGEPAWKLSAVHDLEYLVHSMCT
jgi:hypothetical protein